ncbi:MAG: hypothetical protein INF91_07620 [Alphaproteobacteria bacterium]|nr:hypothetical protein [Alphaproteobacteria bacterium]
MTPRPLPLLVAAASVAAAPLAARKVEVDPRVNVRQVLDLGLSGDDTTTYTEVSAGLGVRIQTRRVNGTIDYSYGRRFTQKGDLTNDDRHNLTARTEFRVTDRSIAVDAGGFASLVNRDLGRGASFTPDADDNNLQQIYSAYVRPRIRLDISDIADLEASYRLGAFFVENRRATFSSTTPNDSIPGTPSSDSTNQQAVINIGNRERSRRLRWDLTGEVDIENIDLLAQRYRSYNGRFEAEYRLARKVGLLASVGYEDIRNTQLAFQTDILGRPIVGPDGSFVVDTARGRNILFDESGVTYQGGLIWTPSRRTKVDLRAGQRYGDLNLSAQASWRPSKRIGIDLSYGDNIQSFGRLLTQEVGGIPTSFLIPSSGFLASNGCILGTDPTTGTCIGNAVQSVTNAQFRNRQAQLVISGAKGRTRYAATAQVSQRRYLNSAALQTPGLPAPDPAFLQRRDRSIALNLSLDQELRGGHSLGVNAFANRYSYALSQARRDTYVGASANWRYRLGRDVDVGATGTVSRRFSGAGGAQNNAIVAISAALRY